MKKFLEEFKAFALKGNVMDLAVGVIIGGAFQAIVTSLVGDIITPIIGIFASTDFSNLIATINGSEVKYGAFITAIINFIIMAFIIFCIVKGLNKLAERKKKEEANEPTEKTCPFCQSTISIKATRCPHCTSALEVDMDM
ncbi:large conductance mechanosensitive channel protein MscL [Catonella massiliensis]|jgi:large conductance mechanosensitive channel protein|uniref:Large-conductance mechanosensitive channel n=1 Tax=Catonella massiliensis TaxID=2799636 RepID=A0ABS1J1U9_9FIRM|nr:large conductance mechanosensitive channel protein MscL [Catonella massiliensis]MBK5897503.1 large conductance mechanosensitive channel protein MscL [Catonella massiliensis]